MKSNCFSILNHSKERCLQFFTLTLKLQDTAQAKQNSLYLTLTIYMGFLFRDQKKVGWGAGGYKTESFQINVKDFLGNLVRYAKQLFSYVQSSHSVQKFYTSVGQSVRKQFFSYNKNDIPTNTFSLFSFQAKKKS